MSTTKTTQRPCILITGQTRKIVAALLIAALAGCSKPVEKTEDVRPVRVVKAAADNINVMAQFSGEVRPRIESKLGFRVGGKITARKVEVGSVVKRGQVLMQLDPQDLQLAQAQANAGLKAAESNHALAKAELARYRELRGKNFVSQAVLDSKETAYQAALATLDQARAAYKNQSNQTSYGTLVADSDGVVTAIDAEAGQVVSAGTPVIRLAKTDEKEVAFGIPEDKVDALRGIDNVQVKLWAKPNEAIAGRIREISPVADPATRTYTAKVALIDPPADVKLGMTAYIAFSARVPHPMIRLPLTAVFKDKTSDAVWVVENGSVKPVAVKVSEPAGNDVLIATGLSPGQIVVTAGVNQLKPGQKVKVLEPVNSDATHSAGNARPDNQRPASAAAAAAAAPSANSSQGSVAVQEGAGK